MRLVGPGGGQNQLTEEGSELAEGTDSAETAAEGLVPIACLKQPFLASRRQFSHEGKPIDYLCIFSLF